MNYLPLPFASRLRLRRSRVHDPAELPLCAALRLVEVSPVFRHRLNALAREPATAANRGFEPPRLPFDNRQPDEVSATYATDLTRSCEIKGVGP